MPTHHAPPLHAADLVGAVVIPLVYIGLCSFLREPNRRHFQGVIIAGAGAAYLNGGLGPWEFGFNAVVTFLAYRGLRDYRFIGVAWLLHVAWDVIHHLYATPIVPFWPTSSAGCAVCDTILAAWCFAGGPSIGRLLAGRWIASATTEVKAGDAR